ncbi:MAG TPA: hypothetical protein DF383_12000, partial [Deltaproteobacteria bacterium]|nr:hypothetical protein [Deltaproteobacteria bacterium]
MKKKLMPDLLKLSVPERIQLAEDLWDSILAFPKSVDLTDNQKEELEKRLQAYHSNPRSASPWDEVR